VTEPAPPGLAERQAALVAALVAGGPLPPGFDAGRVGAAARALRRKRAGEVARAWPMLAASAGGSWAEEFGAWAAGRAPGGSLLDGWRYARERRAAGGLLPLAAWELAEAETVWVERDGALSHRRGPAIRRAPGGWVLRLRGRAHRLGAPIKRSDRAL
jgi:hypothetical protein